jgi:hypothetical protein
VIAATAAAGVPILTATRIDLKSEPMPALVTKGRSEIRRASSSMKPRAYGTS